MKSIQLRVASSAKLRGAGCRSGLVAHRAWAPEPSFRNKFVPLQAPWPILEPPIPDDPPFVPGATLDLVDPGWSCAAPAGGRPTSRTSRWRGRTGRAPVPGLLARFRCGTCGKPPTTAGWIGDAAGGPPSHPAVRRVPLRLPPSAPPLPHQRT